MGKGKGKLHGIFYGKEQERVSQLILE